jgi:hypothetical protein
MITKMRVAKATKNCFNLFLHFSAFVAGLLLISAKPTPKATPIAMPMGMFSSIDPMMKPISRPTK